VLIPEALTDATTQVGTERNGWWAAGDSPSSQEDLGLSIFQISRPSTYCN
jgi:hypothetical protein